MRAMSLTLGRSGSKRNGRATSGRPVLRPVLASRWHTVSESAASVHVLSFLPNSTTRTRSIVIGVRRSGASSRRTRVTRQCRRLPGAVRSGALDADERRCNLAFAVPADEIDLANAFTQHREQRRPCVGDRPGVLPTDFFALTSTRTSGWFDRSARRRSTREEVPKRGFVVDVAAVSFLVDNAGRASSVDVVHRRSHHGDRRPARVQIHRR